jgi:hypothetical protein
VHGGHVGRAWGQVIVSSIHSRQLCRRGVTNTEEVRKGVWD